MCQHNVFEEAATRKQNVTPRGDASDTPSDSQNGSAEGVTDHNGRSRNQNVPAFTESKTLGGVKR